VTSWNRLFNYQRDGLVKLSVRTTEAERRRALSYVDRKLVDVNKALAGEVISDLGLIVAIARYEDAGWMPDGCMERWRRWKIGTPRGVEQKSVDELVQWLEEAEQRLRDGDPLWGSF
jgi:hypothetical protein